MKRLFMALLLMTGFAHGAGLTQISLPSKTFGERMKEFQERRSAGSGIRPESFIKDGYVSAILFQAAGSLPGSNGTFFKSDVMLSNNRQVAQNIAIYWLPAGQNNLAAAPYNYVLNGESNSPLDDFVTQTLEQSGLGAVAIFSVDANGGIDLAAQIDGFSRIWTPEPGGTGGTTSLQLPGLNLADLVGASGGTLAVALGMKQDANYHCNVGIVNLDTVVHTWRVQAVGTADTVQSTVTVQPFSLTQIAIPAGNLGDVFVNIFPNDVGQYIWSAYAVTDDNRTGDGWQSHAHF